MTRAAILTRWVQVMRGGEMTNLPAVVADVALLPGETVSDITGQAGDKIPPAPNVVIVEVDCSAATLTAIKAHAQYGAAAVLWEGDPSQSPVVTTGQYNALVTFLANKFSVAEAAVRTLLGATAAGRTRVEIAQEIIAYLRTRPKG